MTIYQKIILILFRLIGLYLMAKGIYVFLINFKLQVLDPLFTTMLPSSIKDQMVTPSPITGLVSVIFDYPILYVVAGLLIFKMSLRLSETVCKGID